MKTAPIPPRLTKVWEVEVYLYEGENVIVGLYSTKEKAEAALAEAKEEWTGPNVESVDLHERKVD